jgi:hypothetical protein
MRLYYYIFYKIYFAPFRTQITGVREWTTMLLVSLILAFNLGSIYMAVIPKSVLLQYGKWILRMTMIGLFILNYLIFLHKEKHNKIIKMFINKPTKGKSIIYGWIILFYAIGSFIVFIKMIIYAGRH